MLDGALAGILAAWPSDLPIGHVHADLFPDNVFFLEGRLSGLIDFYFAATDTLAYDVAVCLNAWCFEADFAFNVTKARALLSAYDAVRPLSAPERAALLNEMGCEAVIDRRAEGYRFWSDEHTQDPKEWLRLGKKIRDLIGRDVDIVFEHPGRSTFAASMYVAKKGGTVVTCAATSGFMMEFDNRHFWMRLKKLVGSHFANYKEAYEANRLIAKGMIHPVMSQVFDLKDTGEAAYQVHHNMHEGKLGVLVLSPEEGLGVANPEMRERLLPQITLYRRFHG